ncbi:GSK-3-binding protein-like [Scleropages formosus]|uniref:GSK-3-binding protein-like n=1 Tax=Scleropages formosus TaxID=113540 RepID=A0A0P7W5K8_SCLFO|nr:GSK-3-binding protein-like [Scleropages formosus]KPP57882.1 GSK-3-binding protein-like [Scleropages formosus]
MPACRKEKYILVEQSVTVDSKDVDALVAKIGEALQLHGGGVHGGGGAQPNSNNNNNSGGAALQRRAPCCGRLRGRALRSRASPYSVPGSSEQDWERVRTWSRKGVEMSGSGEEGDDPHRLLQELILSGNLIKEAVRRLQFSAAERGEHARPTDTRGVHC